MRLFIGIPLGIETGAELAGIVAQFKPIAEGWRWSPPEGWHITLQFLGNSTPDQLQQLIPRLHAIQAPAIPVRLGSLNLFDRAGVFFADVVVSPQLLALQQTIVAATTPCGFVPEPRPYHPHITLARLKGGGHGKGLRALREKVGLRRVSGFVAPGFHLYQSFADPGGSRYEVRASPSPRPPPTTCRPGG